MFAVYDIIEVYGGNGFWTVRIALHDGDDPLGESCRVKAIESAGLDPDEHCRGHYRYWTEFTGFER